MFTESLKTCPFMHFINLKKQIQIVFYKYFLKEDVLQAETKLPASYNNFLEESQSL